MRVPDIDAGFARDCRKVAHRIALWLGPHDPLCGEWIDSYTGRKRTMYMNALQDLQLVPFNKRDRFLKSFIKAEKMNDPTKDPRMIQARNPRYNITLGNYLKSIEHKLYGLRGSRCLQKLLPSGRLIAKGMDNYKRAERINEAMQNGFVCYSIDASRFDAHVNQTLLNIEHSIYLKCFKGDRTLQKCLNYQLVNHGWTANGIRYKCPGGRMSGDMNTALGNCLIMVLIVATIMRRLKYKTNQWDMFCDGDDTLIFVSSNDVTFCSRFCQQFQLAGMSIKIESVAHTIPEIVHCQSKLVTTKIGDKMIPNPWKVLSCALTSNKLFASTKNVGDQLTLLGLCYMSIFNGVPVLQEFATAMLRNGSGRVPERFNMSGALYRARAQFYSGKTLGPVEIIDLARISFEEAFGISWRDQLTLEHLLSKLII